MIKHISSEWHVVDEVEDSVIGGLSLELRGHMSSTVHCSEGEASITNLDVSSNLLSIHVGNVVRSPGFLNFPAEVVENPLLGSVGGNCTISITRVLEDLISSLEDGIDPVACIHGRGIVELRGVCAKIPLR